MYIYFLLENEIKVLYIINYKKYYLYFLFLQYFFTLIKFNINITIYI